MIKDLGRIAATALAVAGLSSMAAEQPPSAVAVPGDRALLLEARAVGEQIYVCQASMGDRTRLEWTLRAPQADLYDKADKKIGKHYAGPTWELNDGSRVLGEVVARDKGPDPEAVAWLLLGVKENSGTGVLGKTDRIQRIDTVGGKPPTPYCDKFQEGRELRVPYRATYRFFGPAR